MTDALRDAEAAARAELLDHADGYIGDLLDAYRDAIEKRVREERDAELRALVDAAFESYGALLALVGQEHPSAVRLFDALFREAQP